MRAQKNIRMCLPFVPKRHATDQRTVALLFACFLASISMLASSSSPPSVTISQIPQLEDGMKVRISGIMVDLWKYESGSESLVLAEPAGGFSVKVVSSPANRPQPSKYADVGDELLVMGELSKSGQVPMIFARSDGISVARESEDVLTIDIIAKNWMLFDGDCIRVKGLLDFDGLETELRLFSYDASISLRLMMGDLGVEGYIGSEVLVSGTLMFDSRTLSIVLLVKSVTGDP